MKILVYDYSFTDGGESLVAWSQLVPNTINIAKTEFSNDYIMHNTVKIK